MALKMLESKRLPKGGDRFVWTEFTVTRPPVQPIATPFAEILKFDPNQPRDPKGTHTGGRFARSPLEQKRRDFMALIKRGEREELRVDRARTAMRDAWTAWSEDTKNRKKPLKPDGAAAKKLPSYKHAMALETEFHAKYDSAMGRERALKEKALELLKVAPELRSKVKFVENPNTPLSPYQVGGAKQALEFFRQFDGSGVFIPFTITADRLEQFQKIFGEKTEFVKNADGTYSIPSKLNLSKADTGRAHADFAGIHIGNSRDLDRQVHHEVAHHIEMKNSAVKDAAVALREQLASKPREVYKLKTINPALDDTEEAVRGNFPDPYTGKLYPLDVATEIVSTGVESYLSDPIRFAKERPEHFNLIFDIMQGKYREKM